MIPLQPIYNWLKVLILDYIYLLINLLLLILREFAFVDVLGGLHQLLLLEKLLDSPTKVESILHAAVQTQGRKILLLLLLDKELLVMHHLLCRSKSLILVLFLPTLFIIEVWIC